jgi:hypothetical protein
MMGIVPFTNIWIYFLAELAGAAVAGLLFKILNPQDK